MAAQLPPTAGRALRVLRFVDVLEDDDPTKLSWTKIGVALSTVFTTITGAVATVQTVVGTVAHTEWATFAAAIGLHAVTKTAHEVKRYTESKP